MNPPASRLLTRFAAFATAFLSISLGSGLVVAPAFARTDVPANLGGGLRKLVQQFNATGGVLDRRAVPRFSADYSNLAVFDAQNRVLVSIHLNGRQPLGEFSRLLQARTDLQDVRVVASTDRYRAGVVDAYVPVGKTVLLARLPGVASVVLVPKPVTDVGLTTSQGVVQHRVDQLGDGISGGGITVGALSDSYDTATTDLAGQPLTIRAADDVASGDLPGTGNPLGNTEPVVVLQDVEGGLDEGRAMLQIIHDMAPKSKLCYATAFGGQANFANNIRALADPALGCGAQVIVDDIIYLDEPFFTDGIVAQAVDEVAAQGVAYFSSAGNRPSTQAYRSDLRLVPATSASLAGTNIKPEGIDPALYAGGLHNFNPSGLDIAQTISIGSSGTIVFQWDDPYDVTAPELGAVILSTTGEITQAAPVASFPLQGTAGQQVSITADGIPSGSTDLILTLVSPDGTVISSVDTGSSPETLVTFLPTSGTYTIQVSGFAGDTGDFTLEVREAFGTALVTSDFNLLFFDMDGNFLFAADDNNVATGQPIELTGIAGPGNIQLVIARANTPPPTPTPASQLRYVWFTSGAPQEYFSYNYPVTYGHNSAAGANGVAAYSPFRPFIPEDFSSPGPTTIYFDTDNNRLPVPEVRLKPDMAALDGANNTFFAFDTSRDADTFPNFFGTSAAAPHAASIAALVLQSRGGPGSVPPTQMTRILQRSAFPHDLDPYAAQGTAQAGAQKVTIKAAADGSATSQFDTSVFRVALSGVGTVSSLTFNGATGNPTGTIPGIVFDARSDGTGFPFTIGAVSGVSAADISAALGATAPPPAVEGQSSTLKVSITPFAFNGRDSFAFGIDRDEAQTAFVPASAAGGNSADLLGAGVLIPEGTIAPGGVSFSGTLGIGRVFSGVFINKIGPGYSSLDGFGFINAERAVK